MLVVCRTGRKRGVVEMLESLVRPPKESHRTHGEALLGLAFGVQGAHISVVDALSDATDSRPARS